LVEPTARDLSFQHHIQHGHVLNQLKKIIVQELKQISLMIWAVDVATQSKLHEGNIEQGKRGKQSVLHH
jgi:hypothetical protein